MKLRLGRVPSLVSSVLLGALVTGFGPFASPASAAIPGLVRISDTSPFNSFSPKSVKATCPRGKKLIGTGAEINGASGIINDLIPNGGENTAPTAVAASGYAEAPFAGKWSITAYAICANPLPGLVRIRAEYPFDPVRDVTRTAVCPESKLLVGTGFGVFGAAQAEVAVTDFTPYPAGATAAPTAVRLGPIETDPGAGNWSFAAYAICANATALPGLELISTIAPYSKIVRKDAIVACPAPKQLLGIGAHVGVSPATGFVAITRLVPNGAAFIAPTAASVTGFAADGARGFSLTAYAICADP